MPLVWQVGDAGTPIRPAQLLEPRRSCDRSDDLWTVFSRVQENTIQGGLSGWGRDPNGRRRRVASREVKGIDQDVRLSSELWLLGERMATLKVEA